MNCLSLRIINYPYHSHSSRFIPSLLLGGDNNFRSGVRPGGRRPRHFSLRSRLHGYGCSWETGTG